MVQSFKYSFVILKNTKGFFISMVVAPVLMILLISLTLAYKKVPTIGYTGDVAPNIDSCDLVCLEEDQIDYFLGMNRGTLVAICNKQGQITSYKSSIENNPLITIIENSNNEKYESKPEISYSIGLMFFKFLTAGELLATYLIKEKQKGTLLRIKNSKTYIATYITGKALSVVAVYSVASLIIISFYQIAGFDFGNSNPFQLLELFTLTILISTGLFIYLSSILKEEGHTWAISTAIIFPLSVISGMLFPIDSMASWMSTIAKISPLYYMQQSVITGTTYTIPILFMLAISLVLAYTGITKLNTAE